MPQNPNPPLEPGDTIDGFRVIAVKPVPELRLLHLHADDSENLFSINFPTPPPDDTGLPHILEHTVLSGSKRFPVRDPFFEMLKMSMATFLNAMTGRACTYYPVASNVKQDLFNLAEVYFDAVFHPLLTEHTFKREGHHLAPADPANPTADLTINGIVFNEMKGAFSNPEGRLYRMVTHGLLPDIAYGRESGGDPERIPDLTYEEFLRFYKTYYHPSNARIIVYGNIPTPEYTNFLKNRLDAFERIEVDTTVPRQPRWPAPRTMHDTYPVGRDEPTAEKTYLVLNWLVGDATNPDDVVALEILEHFLLGNEAAPLKKALIDSGLGHDLVYSGFGTTGFEATFHVGLKGSEPDRLDAVTTLVNDTLTAIADAPLEPDRVEAAFQQVTYHHREIGEDFPLKTMSHVLDAWLYGADPTTFLHMNRHLEQCHKRWEADPGFFNRIIRERLLDNPHRLTVVLSPDPEWQARTDAAFAKKMKALRDQLTEEQINSIAEEAAALEKEAGELNSPEALASLPQLKVADLPKKPREIPTAVEKIAGNVAFLRNDVFANGVNYLHLNFDLEGLPHDLWVCLPRYMEAVNKLGAAGMSYEQIARRTAASTGGIACRPVLDTHAQDPARSVLGLRVTLKALDEQIQPALQLLGDILFGLDPRDPNRLRDVLIQSRTRYRTELVHNGAVTAARHAGRALSLQGHLAEILAGLPQLAFTEDAVKRFDSAADELMRKIEAVRDFLLARERLTVSFTGSDRAGETVRAALADWIARMRTETPTTTDIHCVPSNTPPREGLAGPIQVAHCARVIPAPHFSHPDEPLIAAGAHIVLFDHILNEIRLKGNAYGAGCRYNALGRVLAFSSYNDPHIARTLQVFDATSDYVRNAQWTQTDIDRAIIGTAKNTEKPIRPEEATELALRRHLTGQTPEIRAARHSRLLSATVKQVRRAFLDMLQENFDKGAVCVVSSREKLEEANRVMKDAPLTIQPILV